MKVISLPRAGGKTSQIILEASKTGAVIVCADRNRKRDIMRWAKDQKLKINEPVIFDEALHNFLRGRSERVIVDDADDLMSSLFGRQVSCISVTGSPTIKNSLDQ